VVCDQQEEPGETPETVNRTDAGLRLAAALQGFWIVRGYVTEGREVQGSGEIALTASPPRIPATHRPGRRGDSRRSHR